MVSPPNVQCVLGNFFANKVEWQVEADPRRTSGKLILGEASTALQEAKMGVPPHLPIRFLV